MNILILTTHLNVGGITSYALSLACGLTKRGHRVIIGSSGGSLIDHFRQGGVSFLQLSIKTKSELSPKILMSLKKLTRFQKETPVDIVHANTRVTQVVSSLLSRRTGVPFVSTCHGFFKTRLSRRLFPCWGKRVIAISPQVKQHLVKDFGIKKEKIPVIYNGIDCERFVPAIRDMKTTAKQKLGLRDAPVIGIVSRLSAEKGHQYLIEAMRSVVGDFPQAQLLIVGDGKKKGELETQVARLSLQKSVVFMNSVSDTSMVLPAIDVFVMPSQKEGLGLSLMEAMASGSAVIGSDVGGISNLIRHRENGLLVEPADSHGLYEAITELLHNAGTRERLGEYAREFIQDNFSLDSMLNDTEEVYKACIK